MTNRRCKCCTNGLAHLEGIPKYWTLSLEMESQINCYHGQNPNYQLWWVGRAPRLGSGFRGWYAEACCSYQNGSGMLLTTTGQLMFGYGPAVYRSPGGFNFTEPQTLNLFNEGSYCGNSWNNTLLLPTSIVATPSSEMMLDGCTCGPPPNACNRLKLVIPTGSFTGCCTNTGTLQGTYILSMPVVSTGPCHWESWERGECYYSAGGFGISGGGQPINAACWTVSGRPVRSIDGWTWELVIAGSSATLKLCMRMSGHTIPEIGSVDGFNGAGAGYATEDTNGTLPARTWFCDQHAYIAPVNNTPIYRLVPKREIVYTCGSFQCTCTNTFTLSSNEVCSDAPDEVTITVIRSNDAQ